MSTEVAERSIAYRYLEPDGAVVAEPPPLEDAFLRGLFGHMLRGRVVEERMLLLQRSGRIEFVGPSTGMEGAVIGSAAALEARDWLWSGLREGSAALMRGMPLEHYVGQMFGNADDTSKGRQMSSHFQHAGTHFPSWSSVIGTQVPHGVGAAWASKQRGEDVVHGVYLGEGATSANGFHSGLNMAAVWKVPAVFVCMHNGWAISVPSCEQSAVEGFAVKADAYGMPGHEVDGNDPIASYLAMKHLVDRARAGHGPALLVLKTYRLLGHSSADDPSRYRDDAEVEAWKAQEPMLRFERYLTARGLLAEGDVERMRREYQTEVDAIIKVQEAAAPPDLDTLAADTFADVPGHLARQLADYRSVLERRGPPRGH